MKLTVNSFLSVEQLKLNCAVEWKFGLFIKLKTSGSEVRSEKPQIQDYA